jgi:hypothetical protein
MILQSRCSIFSIKKAKKFCSSIVYMKFIEVYIGIIPNFHNSVFNYLGVRCLYALWNSVVVRFSAFRSTS